MKAYDFIIVGAGFAGAASAYHLTRRGVSNILILEQESIPGFHASGRNAAMMRQCVPDPDLAKLTRAGAEFLRKLPSDWPEQTVTHIALTRLVLTITVARERISITAEGKPQSPMFIYPPDGPWKVALVDKDGKASQEQTVQIVAGGKR